MPSWATVEGAPFPQGVTWIEDEQAYNFALYSKHADSVTLLLYRAEDAVHPAVTYRLDYLKHKSWRIWHCRLPKAVLHGAQYYAYVVSGPPPRGRFEWHHFD